MKYVYLDFEYFNSSEAKMSLVCCSIRWESSPGVTHRHTYWLHQDLEAQFGFSMLIHQLVLEGHTFVSYNAIAEARGLISLGIDPTSMPWIDLMLEWKQLRNGNHKRLYGKYIKKDGSEGFSVAPPVNDGGYVIPVAQRAYKDRNKDNSLTPHNLVSCVYNLLGVNLDAPHKKAMVAVILTGGPYSSEQQKKIEEYCAEDVEYLPKIHAAMQKEICQLVRISPESYVGQANVRGEWAVRLALVESVGIPVNVDRLKKIAENYEQIKNVAIKHLCENFYPFFEWQEKIIFRGKPNERDESKWVKKAEAFSKFVQSTPEAKSWPKTAAGGYSSDKETLERYESYPQILELRRTNEILNQIKSFKDGVAGSQWEEVDGNEDLESGPNTFGKENIFKRTGSDSRLRCYFNPYGTQTGRNAPPATNFIFAQSAWIRSCIQAPEGYAVTGGDFASQEVLLAALISGDKALKAAYESGDVYLAFGKQAGLIPPNGTKASYSAERNACKSTVLGMQFMMGITSLHRKLMVDTRNPNFTLSQAEKLYESHREIYSDYWEWNKEIIESYSNGDTLRTPDGWMLFPDNPNPRSSANFPIQGAGGVVLRLAVRYCQQAGLKVCATLHDAIYVLHKVEETVAVQALLKSCMQRAFKDAYQGDVRVDIKTVPHDQLWVEEKGLKRLLDFSKYFLADKELQIIERFKDLCFITGRTLDFYSMYK